MDSITYREGKPLMFKEDIHPNQTFLPSLCLSFNDDFVSVFFREGV